MRRSPVWLHAGELARRSDIPRLSDALGRVEIRTETVAGNAGFRLYLEHVLSREVLFLTQPLGNGRLAYTKQPPGRGLRPEARDSRPKRVNRCRRRGTRVHSAGAKRKVIGRQRRIAYRALQPAL
jgi:hypothetical protein